MKLVEKLIDVEKTIEAGEVLKACDRLSNLIHQYPDDPQLWQRLAELYFQAGFYNAAGLFWILTEPNTDEQRKCVEIYEKSVKNSARKILEDLKYRGNRDNLSEFGRRKLESLEAESLKTTGVVPKFSPWDQTPKTSKTDSKPDKNRSVHIRCDSGFSPRMHALWGGGICFVHLQTGN